ncbi:cystathionine-beta-synthase domain-containing protein [Heterostelium album PN500]|uniref:Cystathionine-beta-synthase domain-containing protein n=1 Tax=Heterostelium pallidum (strain ATCC 26659 / Pp 5 / PN500) TaxID=670386 RepID=D3BKP4_HETP5|nr:cystathionine-beta-synthase domain-containing protein [Heterostelium album PN500]EFA78474.1 cystathionine-beta-synthase domain-containing protein [Heterostelium album PN500]|eukprot:XP_020430598.1 cystathionine-beta-synthase domain-containing protein [Heterostelium album PN500]
MNQLMLSIGHILPNKSEDIYSVKSNDYIFSAFKVLYDIEHRKFNKFIDMIDIVAFCMKNLTKTEMAEMDMVMETKEIFKQYRVGQICDLSARNPFLPVEATAPLKVAIELMVKWNVHRVPVIDSEGTLVSILTQSRVLEFINNHVMEFNENGVLLKKIEEISNLGTSDVISITDDNMAIEAFQLIYDKKVSAVAILNDKGELTGNISVSDLKMIGYDGGLMSRLFLPIRTFTQMVPKDKASPFFTVICVRDTTSLEELLVKFQLSKVHRIYHVNDSMKPIQVISQGDVLKSIIKQDSI